eukprot:TRINITY_DN8044_c0_g1_i1.p1 TRINITY_DN8044_c0_g1~~TRINITY_DN8044_c0_g1_i1.p1  ORF type:complete len:425 (+),score=114.30 TRINITY_DN8044_c0_g1_i1:84-1277(+)
MAEAKPLAGIRVVEIAGLAPAPFAGLCLADFGADVVRIDRAEGGKVGGTFDTLARGKRSVALDLKKPAGRDALKRLCLTADVLIEPFRPGVMERLGLGPDELLAANPRLVYARMTGFGQGGDPEVRDAAGHDINYLAVSGVLSALRMHGQRPNPPVNILGDFAGGGFLCAWGILLALFERQRSGKGQVVDAAMVDGAAYLSSFLYKGALRGAWRNDLDGVGTNLLDGGAPFYRTYTCKCGGHFAVGAIEPQFYRELVRGLGLEIRKLPGQLNRKRWSELHRIFEERFLTKTRGEWAAVFRGTDACAFPVHSIAEAVSLPHNRKRGTFVPIEGEEGGIREPGPAPRLSRTPGHSTARILPQPGQHTRAVLCERGFSAAETAELLAGGAAAQRRDVAKL